MKVITVDSLRALPVLSGFFEKLRIENIIFAMDKPEIPGIYANPNIRLIFPLFGSCYHVRISLNGELREIALREGDILCCLPGACVQRVNYPRDASLSVAFMKNCTRFSYREEIETETVCFYHSTRAVSPGGHLQLRGLISFVGEKRSQPTLVKAAQAVFATLTDDLTRESVPGSKALQTFQQALYTMQNNFQKDINREDIAGKLQITSPHLSRLFKTFGIEGFADTLARMRLEYAAELLRETRMGIDEIAEQSGFQSSSYFIKVFKKFYGVTPTAFRA